MALEEGIVSRINSQVATLNGKLYPIEAPEQISAPYATYNLISTIRMQDLDGYPSSDMTMMQRIQITNISTSYSNVKALNQSVISAFRNFTGALGGVTVQQTEIDNEFVLRDDITDYYKGYVDLIFHY